MNHNYIAFYDNLIYTPSWLSDEVCKAVTGVGSTKRKLYSDDDDIVYEYKQVIGFNGINLVNWTGYVRQKYSNRARENYKKRIENGRWI